MKNINCRGTAGGQTAVLTNVQLHESSWMDIASEISNVTFHVFREIWWIAKKNKDFSRGAAYMIAS